MVRRVACVGIHVAMIAWMNGPATEPMVSLCGEFGAGGKDVADEFFPSLTARGIVP